MLLCPWNSPGKNIGVVPYPSPGDLPDLGIRPTSLTSPTLAGGFFTTSTTWEARSYLKGKINSEEREETCCS